MEQSLIKRKALDCLKLLERHSTSTDTKSKWFDEFCSEFLAFAENLQMFLLSSSHQDQGNNDVIFLCLKQICVCIKFMERAMKLEQKSSEHNHLMTSIQHFLDRIRLCLDRLCSLLEHDTSVNEKEHTFFDLMDMLLENLEPYETDDDECVILNDASFVNKYRSMIDEVLSHTLAFANVALDEDKRALSALCQQVFRECVSFQAECEIVEKSEQVKTNRKLKATSLTNALYKLEDYINKSLLRLIYVCFLGYEKFSIEKLRTMQLCGNIDESTLDEYIADFDVNLDRTTQIGVFANAFAPDVKTKTIVRSCLASFEALDSFLIPAVLSKPSEYLISVDILEQHFHEEINNFKVAIQEIVDSYAFTICYQDQLDECMAQMEKEFCKNNLEDILDMGQVLCEHFELKSNYVELENKADLLQCFEKFLVILRECAAILVCCKQVDQQRILKRFKILRSVLGKFTELLCHESTIPQNNTENDQSICTTTDDGLFPIQQQKIPNQKSEEQPSTITKLFTQPKVLRKESLRTNIFKRRKAMEFESADSVCSSNNATSFLMSEILNQLTLVSTDSNTQEKTK